MFGTQIRKKTCFFSEKMRDERKTGGHELQKNFQSIIIRKKAIKDDMKINKSCFPCLFDRLKISFASSLKSDA